MVAIYALLVCKIWTNLKSAFFISQIVHIYIHMMYIPLFWSIASRGGGLWAINLHVMKA